MTGLIDSQDLSFRYFPESYRWSHGLLMALNSAPWGGAEIGEVHRVGLRLRDRVGDDDAWFAEWRREAEKVEGVGRELLVAGHRHSARAFLLRAACYYQVGERFVSPKTPDSDAAYRRSLDCFADAQIPGVERVEVPYEGGSLPALFVRGAGAQHSPRPAMVYLDGFDITKELQYLKGVADLAARGVSCLLVDGPGNGEAVRFRGLPLHHETERYATPAYEWLAERDDVRAEAIGIMAISLGGYYAPRAAAMEPRFACCVAWGPQWDYHATWQNRFAAIDKAENLSLSVPWQHLFWVLGVEDRAAAMQALEGFRLDGVVQRMRCPFLLMHGEGDEQIPMSDAQACFDAVGSEDKTLRIFTREEGGFHHCQIDNVSVGIATMWDWVEQVLQP